MAIPSGGALLTRHTIGNIDNSETPLFDAPEKWCDTTSIYGLTFF
jgi:hypothetical protein